MQHVKKSTTDSGGIGYIEIDSSIPYGEYEDALKAFESEVFDTPNFGFRLAVNSTHYNLLTHLGSLQAIKWAIT